jgi:hypothetical protein
VRELRELRELRAAKDAAGLPAALRITLDAMTYSESLELLETIAGASRIGREPQETAAVPDACAGLSLALRICAARLETRPSWSVRRVASWYLYADETAIAHLGNVPPPPAPDGLLLRTQPIAVPCMMSPRTCPALCCTMSTCAGPGRMSNR